MSIYKSLFKVRGAIDDLQFYESDGKKLIRSNNPVTKEQIMKDESFQRTRENMQEFGGAAHVGKALRKGFGPLLKGFADGKVSARLTGVMSKVIHSATAGVLGERLFEPFAHRHQLVGFELNKSSLFSGSCRSSFDVVVSGSRDQATVTIPMLLPGSELARPQGGTHFRLTLIVTALSNHSYSATTRKYEPSDLDLNGLRGIGVSPWMSLNQDILNPTVLSAALPAGTVMTGSSVLVAALGIEFSKLFDNTYYLLAQNNAMQIVAVG